MEKHKTESNWTDKEAKALPDCADKIRKTEPVYLLRITAQFKTQVVNIVKDSAAGPDHERVDKQFRIEKVRQKKKKKTTFFLNKVQVFILISRNTSLFINYMAMNQDNVKTAFGSCPQTDHMQSSVAGKIFNK